MKSLVLVGAGGHARSVADVARAAGRRLAGCIAPGPADADLPPVLGGDDWLDRPEARGHEFVVAAGQTAAPDLRRRLYDTLLARSLPLAQLRSPAACVSDTAALGPGTVVHHRAVVGPGARVGANCIVNTGAIVEHDARVGDHTHVSTGAIVNGGTRIGSGCMLGSGSVVLQGVRVGDGVVIGAGAVVARDIGEPGVYAGVPARRIK